MISWIVVNQEWLFSGIGIFIISSFIGLLIWVFKKNKTEEKTLISSSTSDKSANVQSKKRIKGSFTSPSPTDIYKDIHSAPPYQQKEMGGHYIGIKAKWLVNFSDIINGTNNTHRLSFRPVDNQIVPTIWCNIDIDEFPRFKTIKSGTPTIITGKIKEVNTYDIELDNVSLKVIDK